jgi:hypothetical protein
MQVKGGRDQIRLEEACRRELRGSGSLPWRPIRVRGGEFSGSRAPEERLWLQVSRSPPSPGPRETTGCTQSISFERHNGFCNICSTREGSRCYNQHQPHGMVSDLSRVAKAAYSNTSALVGMSSCKISGASCRTAPNHNYYLLRDTGTDAAGKSPVTKICKLTIPL